MTRTATPTCRCGTPLQPVMSATSPNGSLYAACPHCDRVCPVKAGACILCRKAGVKS